MTFPGAKPPSPAQAEFDKDMKAAWAADDARNRAAQTAYDEATAPARLEYTKEHPDWHAMALCQAAADQDLKRAMAADLVLLNADIAAARAKRADKEGRVEVGVEVEVVERNLTAEERRDAVADKDAEDGIE